MQHSLRTISSALAITIALCSGASAQDGSAPTDILQEADPILNRLAEIDTVLVDPSATEDQRRVALQDLLRVREDFDALYARAEKPDNRELITRWRNAATEIYNNHDGASVLQPLAPSERRGTPDKPERLVAFEPSPLPTYDGPETLDHVALRNRIDELQTALYDHSFQRPAANATEDLILWDGRYNELLRETIYAQENLLFNRGGTFTDEERAGLQDAYNRFHNIKQLLDVADAENQEAQELRFQMGEIERAYVRQQNLLAQGGNWNNTWKTEWLQSAYLKMAYNMLSAELVDVDADYSAAILEILEQSQPAQADLLDVLEQRMQRGRDIIQSEMAEGERFQLHPARGGVMRREIDNWITNDFFKRMNNPLVTGNKSAEDYKGRVDGILLGMQNGELSDAAAVAALRDTRDEMTRQKPYKNKRADLIKEIDRTNKEIDSILYKKKN